MSDASCTRSVVLVGPMGAGKTSVGRRVARELGVEFRDSDKIVVRDHGPIPAIFEEHGEAVFRQWEREAVQAALAAGGVVSLGGGAVLDPATRADLSAHSVVLLTVTPEVVASRIGGSGRPLLTGGDAVERWARIYRERRPLYDEVADVEFDTSRGPLAALARTIAAWANERHTKEQA